MADAQDEVKAAIIDDAGFSHLETVDFINITMVWKERSKIARAEVEASVNPDEPMSPRTENALGLYWYQIHSFWIHGTT